jgi:hypothetical protein
LDRSIELGVANESSATFAWGNVSGDWLWVFNPGACGPGSDTGEDAKLLPPRSVAQVCPALAFFQKGELGAFANLNFNEIAEHPSECGPASEDEPRVLRRFI